MQVLSQNSIVQTVSNLKEADEGTKVFQNVQYLSYLAACLWLSSLTTKVTDKFKILWIIYLNPNHFSRKHCWK